MREELLTALVKRLILTEPDSAPMLSCFVDLGQPRSGTIQELKARARLMRHALPPARRSDFDDALIEILAYLERPARPGSQGAAIYSRWGDQPVFQAAQFQVPMDTRLSVGSRPEIYPLVELKDTYHRFVIVITTETEARILETALGSVTEEILSSRPDLRGRFGREWTREHYQNHKREREDQFIREKIRIVDDLMSRRGHNHLIVAGSPKMAARFTRALPPRLREKLVSTVPSNPREGIAPIVREAVNLFVAAEDIESHQHVERLESAWMRHGLATIGFDACRKALLLGCADLLIVDQDHEETDQREELVRLAESFDIPVETVNRNPTLRRLGGFGCLLRYHPDRLRAESLAAVA